MHGLVGTPGFRPRCLGHLVTKGHLPQAERGCQRHESGGLAGGAHGRTPGWCPLCLCSGGLGSRPGRPGSGKDQCESPNSSCGACRGHTETLAQDQPLGLGASAAADGSQDPATDQTQTREPRVSSSLDRVPLPPLDKNFGERGDPVCCSWGCNRRQGNLASIWFREKL